MNPIVVESSTTVGGNVIVPAFSTALETTGGTETVGIPGAETVGGKVTVPAFSIAFETALLASETVGTV